eukprot:6404252-Prymnesium_polylepis.1
MRRCRPWLVLPAHRAKPSWTLRRRIVRCSEIFSAPGRIAGTCAGKGASRGLEAAVGATKSGRSTFECFFSLSCMERVTWFCEAQKDAQSGFRHGRTARTLLTGASRRT